MYMYRYVFVMHMYFHALHIGNNTDIFKLLFKLQCNKLRAHCNIIVEQLFFRAVVVDISKTGREHLPATITDTVSNSAVK